MQGGAAGRYHVRCLKSKYSRFGSISAGYLASDLPYSDGHECFCMTPLIDERRKHDKTKHIGQSSADKHFALVYRFEASLQRIGQLSNSENASDAMPILRRALLRLNGHLPHRYEFTQPLATDHVRCNIELWAICFAHDPRFSACEPSMGCLFITGPTFFYLFSFLVLSKQSDLSTYS